MLFLVRDALGVNNSQGTEESIAGSNVRKEKSGEVMLKNWKLWTVIIQNRAHNCCIYVGEVIIYGREGSNTI